MNLQKKIALTFLASVASASTFALDTATLDLTSLTSGLDFGVVVPLVLAAGAAVIGWDVIKGGIMGVIGMISTATRR